MPTIRSPGTAPPSGAKRTGSSPVMPRIGMAVASAGPVGTLNFTALAFLSPNQPLDDAASEPGILLAHRGPRRTPDRRARLAGDHDRFPCRRWRELRPRSQDLDLVAIGELGDQRRDLAVDLAADRGVADVGMDRVGEIDRRRLARQRDQLALRREAEHLVVE